MTAAAGQDALAPVPLPWDSEALGRPVARADVTGRTAEELRALLDGIRRDGTSLVYLFGAAADAVGDALLDAAGARLVDRRTTFVRDADVPRPGAPALPDGIVPCEAAAVDAPLREALRGLALAAGEYSRFRVDPRFPRATFERIYGAWIERSLSHAIADAVYVAHLDGRLAGLVTVGVKDGRGDIGLLAVAEHARGCGVGRRLVAAANAWAAARALPREQVVTQAANAPACHLYAACGYAVERVVPVRHLWRDA